MKQHDINITIDKIKRMSGGGETAKEWIDIFELEILTRRKLKIENIKKNII